MFTSLNGGYVPIIVLVLGFAWIIAKVKNIVIRSFLTIASPLIVSFAWYFVPRFFELFRPLESGEDPWVGWGVVASSSWALLAVPVSILSVCLFALINRRKNTSQ